VDREPLLLLRQSSPSCPVVATVKTAIVVLMAMGLTACGSSSSSAPSVTQAAATSTPFSTTSPTYLLLGRIASDAYSIFTGINTVTLTAECAIRSSSQCQMVIPEAMQQEYQGLQQDVSSLVTSGVLAAYGYYSPIASDLRDLQDDLNQLPGPLGQEIQGLEADNPDEIHTGTQAQSQLAGISNSALAIRNAITTP
jgi:hypothetical protein